MPLGPEFSLVDKKFFRGILMTKYASKFVGFLADSELLSRLLATLKPAQIPRNLLETFRREEYSTLNEAFPHRYKRQLYPLPSDEIPAKIREKIMASPVDAYLNIREIKNEQIELFPELVLDLKKMIGAENSAKFSAGGKFLLFTLKPFHDHTVDYPLTSKVLSPPIIFSRENSNLYSTDLNFARKFAQKTGQKVFTENQRVVTELEAVAYREPYFMVEVGATNVNSISQDNCEMGETYAAGTQKSHFNFGSTVILLLPASLASKIKFLDIFSRDFLTSVEVKRRNVLAVPKDFPFSEISVADGVRETFKENQKNLTNK